MAHAKFGSKSNMTVASKLWRNARIATCDDSMRVIEQGAMITTGDRIAWIGPEAQIPAAGAGARPGRLFQVHGPVAQAVRAHP